MKKPMAFVIAIVMLLTYYATALACDGILIGPDLVCNRGAIPGESDTHVKKGLTCTKTEYLSYATEYCTWCSQRGNTRCGPYLCCIGHTTWGIVRDYWCSRNHRL